MPGVEIDETRIDHIFRDAEGHFRVGNAANRQILIDVANRQSNFLGADRAGNTWYAEDLLDGTQIWLRVRGDKIVNGGINQRPRDFTGPPR